MKGENESGPGQAHYSPVLIRELVESVPLVGPETPVMKIKEMIDNDDPITAVVVVSENRPVGLIMSIHLDRTLSHRFGVSLYYEKPVSKAMDPSPLMVEGSTPLAKVADMAMARERTRIFDHIIITEEGKIAGIVCLQNILNRLLAIEGCHAEALDRVNAQLVTEIKKKETAEQELLKLNKALGDRVSERTAELQASNEKLRLAAMAADAANRAKSDFLANMSHELRTPLNHIIGFTELVLDQHFGPLNDTQNEYLRDVVSSSKHLLSLINDILDLSKVEAGRLELRSAEVNLKALLENSLIMVKEKAMKHGIRLATRIRNIPDTIEADERKLKQIFYNLLTNSVKFTPDGGSVCLSAQMTARTEIPHPIGVPDESVSDYLEISVADTGIGLREEDCVRIFQPFVQVDSSSTRRYQGTGLGLSLTKRLVELHRGRIWVESEGEGKGSVFRVFLPLCQDSRKGEALLGLPSQPH
jgi:signal transduction histidine kinase